MQRKQSPPESAALRLVFHADRPWRALALALGLACAASMTPLHAQSSPSAAPTPGTDAQQVPGAVPHAGALHELVREWIALAQEKAATIRDWDEHRRLLEDEQRLLEKANAEWLAELERLGTEHTAASTRHHEREARLEHLETGIVVAITAVVERCEADAAAWAGRLPEPLAATLKPHLTQIAANRKSRTPATDLPLRTRSVLAFFAELEALDRTTHDGKMLVTVEDATPREVDVLIFGIGAGYMLSADHTLAGFARPDHSGNWTWVQDDDVASAVQRALECHRRERPAIVVGLPLAVVVEEAGP